MNRSETAVIACVLLLAACKPEPKPASAPGTNEAPTVSVAAPSSQVSKSDTNVLSGEVEFDIDKASQHLTAGNQFLEQGRFREAIEQFELAVKFNPEDEDLFYNLALAQSRSGDKEAAKKNYTKSLEIYPDYVEAHNNLGNILVAEGNFAEAIEHFQKALANDDKHASTHNNLGTAYARQKKVASALNHFETALQLQPDYPDAQYNLGNAYLLMGRVDDAIEQYNNLLRLHPDFQRARVQLEKAKAMKAGAPAR